jgi:hypothetical protein
MKKGITVFLLLLAICGVTGVLSSCVSTTPRATYFEESDFKVTVANGEVTITKYTGSGGDVVIPARIQGLPVTAIGDRAFYECTSLTSVSMSSGLTYIGERAFYKCTGLTSVSIPDGVTSIGRDAFWDCTDLTSISIPASVTSIGDHAFLGCDGLTSITVLAAQPPKVGKYSFKESTTVIHVPDIPAYLEADGWKKYAGNIVNMEGQKPEEYRLLDWFEGPIAESNPNDGHVPWKVLWVIAPRIDATADGVRYTTVMSAEQIELVKAQAPAFEAFVEAHTNNKLDIQITIDVLQNPVTDVSFFSGEAAAFAMPVADAARLSPENNYDSCFMSADFTGIPHGIWHGKNYGFYSSVIYTQEPGRGMSYDNQFVKRDVYVHEWCHQLESYFPSLDPELFAMPVLHGYMDSQSYGYTAESTGLPGKYVEAKWYADYLAGTIARYPGATNTLKGVHADWWQYHPLARKSGITISINSQQTAGDFELEVSGNTVTVTRYTGSAVVVEIPAQINDMPVTSIGSYAFNKRRGLTAVTIPDSVAIIGTYAFSGCSGLTSVTIPNSVTSIGGRAFFGCTGLTSVTIPNSVTAIGNNAFSDCTGLTSVAIPNSVTSIGGWAFSGCSGLTSVTIPNSVTAIGQGAFRSCSSLTSATIPSSVTSIKAYAFFGCSSLTSVTIPGSVTSIGYSAFEGCSNLGTVRLSRKTTVADGAFKGTPAELAYTD